MKWTAEDLRGGLGRTLIGLSGIVGGIALWWAVVNVFDIEPYVVPPPGDVWKSLTDDFSILMDNLWPTAQEALLGFAIGNLLAIAIAIVFVHNKTAERSFFPVAVFVQTLPLVAVAPVLVLMFGNGMGSKVIIAALMTLFPTLVNMVRGFNAISPQTLELFRVLSASKLDVFWKARTFTSLPFLFSSLKIASTSAVVGAIIAEWIGADKGLGYLIINATYNFQTPLLYSTMIVASLFALLLFAIIGLIEKLVVTWETDD
ncbi:ABC transporter permease [Conexibacter woesei]|uniref:Binding-protein-dependent transport systems inner membrane component n=1 Tax=Conexibacter woesei (strain DSM 14684 / CCUG 47730 / CIP 108061 / JCM 11494 / NBRC 100937 / ID131577) TaxID=469383 RepID=D3F2G1_CONWI|nr:ABC transporter permease [Conexibacter woesei]ADB52227.1 binding-protein-dependent transport systems inner membrane component [Conexibacter woesei DSM 14684]